jgi:1-acyl-sn-glycerol-3-phosphate acyltransferase
MVYFRSALYWLGMLVVTPVFAAIALLFFFLPPLTRYHIITGWARSMLWWLKVTCGLSYEVKGRENIPDHPVVILSKHQSAWETLAFQEIFPAVCWVLKRELLYIPFFGWGLAMTSPIAIDRAARRDALKQVAQQGAARLKTGFYVVIFPEGTRTAPGTRGTYNPGGAFLAVQTRTPVLPVAHNAGEFWRKDSFLKYPGVVKVSIGPVMSSEGIKATALNKQAEEWIETEMTRLNG